MVTSNILQRVTRLQARMSGSAFTFETDDSRQYLATARHVVQDIAAGANVELMIDNAWQAWPLTGAWHSPDPTVDVSVLSFEQPILPAFSAELTTDGLTWGQEVYFLGYPFGISGGAIMHDGRPLPFIKHGIMSGSEGIPLSILYVDGSNNPGFSGGPLVFRHGSAFRVAGVISGWKSSLAKVEVRDLLDSTFRESETLRIAVDTGIVTAYSIHHALDGARQLGTGALVQNPSSSA